MSHSKSHSRFHNRLVVRRIGRRSAGKNKKAFREAARDGGLELATRVRASARSGHLDRDLCRSFGRLRMGPVGTPL